MKVNEHEAKLQEDYGYWPKCHCSSAAESANTRKVRVGENEEFVNIGPRAKELIVNDPQLH